ncbi:Transmembrane protein 271 [Frankliniella fusca]|uniref:Transmembrane protein 271 n=1 Tax=Frankliniella fusca TaxID=407009 RepID=A0AAE1L9S6_9NEOP|nr:Transmembrane protein 271 [Frankliniella fusca]
MPFLDYGSQLFTDMSKTNMEKIQKAENACIRFVTSATRFEHISPYYVQLGLLKYKERQMLAVATITRKIIKNDDATPAVSVRSCSCSRCTSPRLSIRLALAALNVRPAMGRTEPPAPGSAPGSAPSSAPAHAPGGPGAPRLLLACSLLALMLLLQAVLLAAPVAEAKPMAMASPDQVLEHMRQIPQWHCLRYRKFDMVAQHKRCRHFRIDRKH